MNIGENLRSFRKAVGLTQEELAKRAGVATITIRQYETNKRSPNTKTISKIANALGIPLDLLLNLRINVESTTKNFSLKHFFNSTTYSELYKKGDIEFDSEQSRLLFFYARLNDSGKLAAESFFLKNLIPEKISDAADFVTALYQNPKFRCQPQEGDENAVDKEKDD